MPIDEIWMQRGKRFCSILNMEHSEDKASVEMELKKSF
jgi:hypothetical protein